MIAALLGAAAAAAVPVADEVKRAQTLTVEKVVLFSRHGIRTPYGAQDMGQKTMAGFSVSWGRVPDKVPNLEELGGGWHVGRDARGGACPWPPAASGPTTPPPPPSQLTKLSSM